MLKAFIRTAALAILTVSIAFSQQLKYNVFTGKLDLVGSSAGGANVTATSAPAVTSLAIDVSPLSLTTINGLLVQCWSGTAAPYSPVTVTSLNPATTSSVTANFSSTANVTCRVNATGGTGPTGATGATGATGPSGLLSGTLAAIPATCTAGASLYQATDQPITTQIYQCTSANTWTRASYTQGTAVPATCSVGQLFFDTDATAGQNVYGCTSANTWTLEGDGGGGGGSSPVYTTTTYSATPTFTVSASNPQGFFITLTGNVTSSTLSTGSATTGQEIWFNICQDATGSRTFVWPTNVLGAGTISGTLSTCSRQLFRWDGTNANAVTPLYVTGGTGASITLPGSTSGSTTIQPSAVASGTITFPAATDTLVGKATTDTFTNKTFDTAGTGNSFSINGVAATANTGTGSVVRATSPTLVNPTLGVATATSVNKVAITAPATGSTLVIADGKTATFSNSITIAGTDSTTMTFPSASATITQTIASGTIALGTSAIASQACATVATASATGVASTDAITWTPNASIKAVTGYTPLTTGGLSIALYPTANTVNADVCNWTSGSITPGAVTLNWRVVR